MANPAADAKAAPLADDLKEFALSLPTTVFPKTFFCALDGQLAIDAYKLLCCNKAICPSCQEKLTFPTTCPSCDHSPLESDSCTPNKALRNTMRVWLQKQKKKEESKTANQAPGTPAETTSAAPEAQPVDRVEDTSKTGGAGSETPTAGNSGDTAQPTEDSIASQSEDAERRGSTASQQVTKSVDLSTTDVPTDEQANASGPNGAMMPNNAMMMTGMSGQMGYSFPNQAGFNNGMGYGMNNMNGMSSIMGNGNWNGMNSMDFNNVNGMPNGLYGNFGGNMGMGMNDMSAMNYGGGYGGWNGIGGGYGNYNNGFNSMGGYNQSGAYPEMMNQLPKNNFSTQNQNRFHANQGGAYPQRNMRNGSQGGYGPGQQNANSRPGSQSGPAHNVRRHHQLPPGPRPSVGKSTFRMSTDDSISTQRDGQSPDGNANTAHDAKVGTEQVKASADPAEEGNVNDEGAGEPVDSQAVASGNADKVACDAADLAENATNDAGALKPIQAFDSGDADMDEFTQSMMGTGMPFEQGMMGQGFDRSQLDPSFNANMNMGYNTYGSRGTYHNGAYGAAKILIDQPTELIGAGVVGAPTGPRAMREGRPNTGFSGRVSSARFVPPPKSVASTHDTAIESLHRRVRSRSPQRDESMRVKNKSPSRSRSRPRARDNERDEHREQLRSTDRDSRRGERERSNTPRDEEDHDRRKERRDYRSSRHDDREDNYDDRQRDDKESRGDRTRSASVESKYRSSRRDKEKHRSSRTQRDRSKEHRRRHRSRSPGDEKPEDDEDNARSEKGSDGSSRRKHRVEKDKYRDRSRDKDYKDRKERDGEYEYERSRDKDKERRRRKDREANEDERDYDDDKYRSSRRSRKDRARERSSRHDERDHHDREYREDARGRRATQDKEEDIVGALMKKRAVSPPLNAPTGPAANGFTIKGRSKNAMPPPAVQPPTGPRAFQPPKGPAADRNRERSEPKDHHRRKSSAASMPSGPATSKEPTPQDHYAAERERNARERHSRDKPPKSASLHSRMSSSSRPSLSSKRSYDDDDAAELPDPSRGPKVPTGPSSSHRDKRKKGGPRGDDDIANIFAAGLRKKAGARRGGIRTECDAEKDLERVERERERR